MAAPERMCIGCRQRRPAHDLIRLTAHEGHVAPATRGAPGRGAYLCPTVACFDAAVARRAASRAFGTAVTMGERERTTFAAACEGRKTVM